MFGCGKGEHQHSEKCYTEITGLTIHAKHGANIGNEWPTYNGSSTWSVNPSGGPYQVNIDTMPMGGDTFYGPKTGQGSETAYYYVEALPGASNTVTVGGIKYVLHHSDKSPGTGYTVTQEDKYPITGFKYKSGTRNENSYNNAKFYYTRNSYDLTFINNGSTDDTKNFKYEASIADAYYVPNRPSEIDASYTFAGWYDNELCEGDPFVFTGKTMPAKGITLYAKWQAPQVNATVYLSASADSKSETFSVPYGKKITESEDFNTIIAHIKTETGEAPSAWFVVTGEGRVLFDLDTPLYSSVTLYPFFASSSEGYTVTYKEEGTDEPAKDEQKYLTGSRAGILAPVNGENFLAWKTEGGTLIHPGDKITVTKNTTLTAVYTNKPQTETITYHYNFGDSTRTFEDRGYPKNTTATVKSLSDVGFDAPTGYEFLGWATARDSSTIEYAAGDPVFVDANGDNNLYAVWQVKTYTVTWKNWNGTVLETDTDVEYNSDPRYDGKNPTRAADAQYTYTFKGWDKPLEKVTKDVTYTAVYEETINKYTVTWVNWDNKELEKDEDVPYGADPEYDGKEPTKAADAQYSYKFTGWNPVISPVTGDVTYKAQFEAVTNKYTVTWVNWDNKELEKDKDVPYGADPEYDGKEPTKAADAQYSYKFTGWNPAVSPVTGDVTYKAQFEAVTNTYTVTYELNGGEWTEATNEFPYEYKATVEVVKTIPTREGYKFSGWRSQEVTIENDAG